jgi:hypothetical protein
LNWIVWRLVVEQVATLQEIQTYYDLCDVFDAHIALNFKIDSMNAAGAGAPA